MYLFIRASFGKVVMQTKPRALSQTSWSWIVERNAQVVHETADLRSAFKLQIKLTMTQAPFKSVNQIGQQY